MLLAGDSLLVPESIGLGLEQDLGLGFAPDMSDIQSRKRIGHSPATVPQGWSGEQKLGESFTLLHFCISWLFSRLKLFQKYKKHKHFPEKPSLTVCLWLKATADWHGNNPLLKLGKATPKEMKSSPHPSSQAQQHCFHVELMF